MKNNLIIVLLLTLSTRLIGQEWTVTIDTGCKWRVQDNIAVDEGESVLGIGYADDDGFVVKIDKDGEYVDRVVHLPGMMLAYYSAVQLDNGNFMVFGVCDDSLCDPAFQRYIRVDVFDNALEPVVSRTYEVADSTFECFSAADRGFGMLKAITSPSGTVILLAAPAYYVEGSGYYRRALLLYELDREGNILVRKPHPALGAAYFQEVTYEPHSDNLLVALQGGSYQNSSGGPGIYVVDMNLEVVARKDMQGVQGGYGYEVDFIQDITMDGRWFDGGRILLNTIKVHLAKSSFPYASLYVIDSALNVYGEVRLPPYDSIMFLPLGTSTAYIDDSTVFATTYCSISFASSIEQANVILLDKHLNLLGRKVFSNPDYTYHSGPPAVFADGGCLIPIYTWKPDWKNRIQQFRGSLMKFRRTDIEITWDLVEEEGTEALLMPYPNPADGIVNIPIPASLGDNAHILLFDAAGTRCLDQTLGRTGNLIRLDTSNLSPGLYLYRIVDGNGTMVEGKFVKK
ncbi:MAG: T9SS type A sorting domain-containing protein [Bacteroidales bacterium]|nr:T9SS type A sorting domain-containing protein [Bacteroidales bacterium]